MIPPFASPFAKQYKATPYMASVFAMTDIFLPKTSENYTDTAIRSKFEISGATTCSRVNKEILSSNTRYLDS